LDKKTKTNQRRGLEGESHEFKVGRCTQRRTEKPGREEKG